MFNLVLMIYFAAVFFGVLTIALSFAAQYFGALVLQVAISVFGMVGSPLAGLLSVGMLVPCVNSWVRKDNLPYLC